MVPSCVVCGATTRSFLTKDGYDLVRCPSCGLAFVHPQPSLKYLRTKVYSTESGFQKGRVEDLAKYVPSQRYLAMYALLQEAKPGGSLLDVGAGGGHFLYHAKVRGFTVAGVELNERLADSARTQGFTMYDGTLSDAAIDPQTFDIVVLGEVIEHVNDPRELVRDAARALVPDGVMLITTPNMDCLWSRTTLRFYWWFGIPWSTSTPPYHLFQFSAHNLDLLLGQEGFERVASSYLPPPTLKYELGSLHLLKRFKTSGSTRDFMFLVFAFGLYIPLYGVCRLVHPLLRQDFSMLHLYRGQNRS